VQVSFGCGETGDGFAHADGHGYTAATTHSPDETMIETRALVEYADSRMEASAIRDYCPNGLQVEGRPRIERLMTGVTANQALLEAATEWGADALLVHHGWFWKNEPAVLVGMKRRRAQTLLDAGINLLAYHLPLDIHRAYGNNAELARVLEISVSGQTDAAGVPGLLWFGRLNEPMAADAFARRIGERLAREPLHIAGGSDMVDTVAWCTGGGQDFIDQAAELGVDAFISGEASERTTHAAREQGLHYFGAGHHATERYGVQALGAHLAERFELEHQYVDIDNPV
jgi:dinuclear metal center YbgI/SA1388 family protein